MRLFHAGMFFGCVGLLSTAVFGADQLQNTRILVHPKSTHLKYDVSSDGRALSAHSVDKAKDAGWGAVVNIVPQAQGSVYLAGKPVLDSRGMGTVLSYYPGTPDQAAALLATRSDPATGKWGAPQGLSGHSGMVFEPAMEIDSKDQIDIIYRDVTSAGSVLNYVHGKSGSSWSGPSAFHTESTLIQNALLKVDNKGQRIVAFWLPENNSVSTLVRSPFLGLWSKAEQVSPQGRSIIMPTLAANSAGDAVYLVYGVLDGDQPGVYVHRFDSSKKQWGPASLIPGSDQFAYFIVGSGTVFPAAVDAAGNLTVLWQTLPTDTATGVYAGRLEGGAWQPRHELLAEADRDCDIYNFGNLDISQTGDALSTVSCFEGSQNLLYAFHFSATAGWQDVAVAFTSDVATTTRARVAFVSGNQAVGTFLGGTNEDQQLSSLAFDGSSWTAIPQAVPGDYMSFFHELASRGGKTLLSFEGMLQDGTDAGLLGVFFGK